MTTHPGALAGVGEPMGLPHWRDFIIGTAALHPDIGPLVESLKWGEASFTPVKRGVGSSVRLALRAGDRVALLFICHTGLVDRFREIYPGLEYEGRRAIVVGRDAPVVPLRHCVTMALTYFLRRS